MNQDMHVHVAPPDKAAAILAERGYPIGATTLRNWYKSGKIPGCFTGKQVLLNIDKTIEYLETGDPAPGGQPEPGSGVRRVDEMKPATV